MSMPLLISVRLGPNRWDVAAFWQPSRTSPSAPFSLLDPRPDRLWVAGILFRRISREGLMRTVSLMLVASGLSLIVRALG